MEFDNNSNDNDSIEYKVKAIWDSAIYTIMSKLGYLPGLYYLVLWKKYPKKENTWEPALVVQHLGKLISLFHNDHLNKPTATFTAINTASLIARLTVKLVELSKQK